MTVTAIIYSLEDSMFTYLAVNFIIDASGKIHLERRLKTLSYLPGSLYTVYQVCLGVAIGCNSAAVMLAFRSMCR